MSTSSIERRFRDLAPWQREVLAKVLERDPDTGRWKARRVTLQLPPTGWAADGMIGDFDERPAE